MRIHHDDMVRLMGEFSRAIPPFLSHDLAGKWIEWLCRVASLMLRCKPDDVFWAIQAFEADAELWAGGDDAACQPNHLSDVDWAAACEMLRGDEDPDRNDYMTNIEWIPVNTDIDVELAEDRSHILGGDDIDCANEWARERENAAEASFIEPIGNTSAAQGGLGHLMDDKPIPADEAMETMASKPSGTLPKSREGLVVEPDTEPKTWGFLCTMPELNRTSLKAIRQRKSWVKSVVNESAENGGRVDLMSIFPDGASNSSWSGYDELVRQYRKRGCCYEEAIWIENHQDSIPMLASLPDGIVIDFPGMRPTGTNGEYGILRMKRGKNRRWEIGFEWISPGEAVRCTDIFSDKVRIAVFVKAA